ncbi:MAG: phosphatase PAP2 family protein [Candidatus Pacebacteria bacterium]|nr:phosphatase PAP2 family protein [Candidatus Paceibacterota bacterium]
MDLFLLNFFKTISIFGSETALVIFLTVISLLLFFSKKRKRLVAFVFFNYLLSMIVVIALKFVIQKERSLLALVEEKTYAFPSGHVALAMTTFLLLFFISDLIKNNFWKNFLKVFAIFWILATIFARLYLRVHDISDIVTSLLLAVFVFIISLTIPSFRKHLLRKEIQNKDIKI